MAITRWLILYLADDVVDVMGEESSGCYLLHELCMSLAENMVRVVDKARRILEVGSFLVSKMC